MTAKEYLNKIQIYWRIMRSYSDRINELYHEASGLRAIVYDKDRVQTSPENKLEKLFEQIDAEAQKYIKARMRYEAEVQKRTQQIAQLDRPEYVEILRLRYVELDPDGTQKSLEQIACSMHLSFWRTAHLHGEALAAFDRRFKVSKH